MVFDKDVGRVGNHKGMWNPGATSSQICRNKVKGTVRKTGHRKGSLTEPMTFCPVMESPREEAGRFLSHSPPSTRLLLEHPDGQIQPEARGQDSLLMQFTSVRHTQKRKLHLEIKKKGGGCLAQLRGLLRFTQI